MGELASRLVESAPHEGFGGDDDALWLAFVAELGSKDLERALLSVRVSERLSDHIAFETRRFIGAADQRVFESVISNPAELPLSRLFRYLFSSTHRTISVVTPNYDRLAEYAADVAGFCHYTGFGYGYIRRRLTGSRLCFSQDARAVRTIDIWKVHGCLDWFSDDQGQIVAIVAAQDPPRHHRPAIVTPGLSKYERTHLEPFRSIIANADQALSAAGAYLCVGFGFNDSHIQPKLMERWRNGEALLAILTKELSDSARSMIGGASGQQFLAFEEAAGGTRAWSHSFPEGVFFPDVNLWRLGDFLNLTI